MKMNMAVKYGCMYMCMLDVPTNAVYCYCRYEQSFEEVMEFEDADPDNIKNVEKYGSFFSS